jgi:glycosyltransferase involved in cell wall biosynthesis
MKIVHIITRLILGGAQENTLLTVDGLHHTFADDVTLLTGPAEGPEGDLFTKAKDRGLKVELVPELIRAIRPRTDYRAYRALRQSIHRLAPDVVHTHSSKAGILGRAAAWDERVPAIVHTIHGLPFGPSESPLKNRAYIALERWAARRCHKIISVADAMTTQALEAGVGTPNQFVTIYSGMDVDPFLTPPRPRAFIRKQLGLAEGEVAFATVARLFERKGHDDLLDIIPDIAATTPRARYVWIGGGIWRDRLEARARDLGVLDRIVFTGLVPPERIPELLGACDAVVHPSYREGLARVLPQGLIAGLPVVSYDVDGAREVCITGETGFLVPFRDRQELRQAIEKLAASADLRRTLGAEGRNRFADQFRHETMTRSIRSLYEQLLASPPGHSRRP